MGNKIKSLSQQYASLGNTRTKRLCLTREPREEACYDASSYMEGRHKRHCLYHLNRHDSRVSRDRHAKRTFPYRAYLCTSSNGPFVSCTDLATVQQCDDQEQSIFAPFALLYSYAAFQHHELRDGTEDDTLSDKLKPHLYECDDRNDHALLPLPYANDAIPYFFDLPSLYSHDAKLCPSFFVLCDVLYNILCHLFFAFHDVHHHLDSVHLLYYVCTPYIQTSSHFYALPCERIHLLPEAYDCKDLYTAYIHLEGELASQVDLYGGDFYILCIYCASHICLFYLGTSIQKWQGVSDHMGQCTVSQDHLDKKVERAGKQFEIEDALHTLDDVSFSFQLSLHDVSRHKAFCDIPCTGHEVHPSCYFYSCKRTQPLRGAYGHMGQYIGQHGHAPVCRRNERVEAYGA